MGPLSWRSRCARLGATPRDAWDDAARRLLATDSLRQKNCPRATYRSLCQEGWIVGVRRGEFTRAQENRRYAKEAVRRLVLNPELAMRGPTHLWKLVVGGAATAYNDQMHVVLALWNHRSVAGAIGLKLELVEEAVSASHSRAVRLFAGRFDENWSLWYDERQHRVRIPPLPANNPSETVMPNRIPRAQLQQMFDNMAATTDWDLNGDMLWGYFFTDTDKSALERAFEKLQEQGYWFVDIFQPEDEGTPLPYFFLHVEKVETHTVDSLYRRNTELEAFARANGLDTYDGMDVGPAGGRPDEV